MIEWLKNIFTKKNSGWVEGELTAVHQVIEIELNQNDLLVLKTEKTLTAEQREKLTQNFECVVKDKNRRVVVIESGFDIAVIHRA